MGVTAEPGHRFSTSFELWTKEIIYKFCNWSSMKSSFEFRVVSRGGEPIVFCESDSLLYVKILATQGRQDRQGSGQ